MPSRSSRTTHVGNGFALTATITLMVLIVMVTLMLLTLATVEVRSNITNASQAKARMNAKLALMKAIGELQIHAGQDQRITLSADFAGDTDGSMLPNTSAPQNNLSHDGTSKNLSSIQHGTRHWTGVWKNRQTNPGISIYSQTPSSEHLAWLVSGTKPKPSDPALQLSSIGQPIDKTQAVVLVGKNTVGPANSLNLPNYVSAPLVNTSQDGLVTGRYAWWIGDEGIKARNNIRSTYPLNAIAETQHMLSNRLGWEAIPGLENYPKPGQDHELEKILSHSGLELLDDSLARESRQKMFHSSTPHSTGLITNSLTGGLKVDLSYYLKNGFPQSAGFAGAPSADENIIPQSIAPSIKGPKWQQLKAFHDIGESATSGKEELIVQSAANPNNHITIAPVLADIRALFGAKVSHYDGSVYRIFPVAKIAVSIANPYAYPLRWDTPLEFELKSHTPANIRPSCIWRIGRYSQFLPQYPHSPACLNNAIMRIPAGVLPAGEARAYTIGKPIERPWGTARVDIDLVPFTQTDPGNFDNSIIQLNQVGYNLSGRSINLDVREGTNTTQMTAELRLGSSHGLLRRIKSFECDNGYFARTTRWLNQYWATRMTRPFPLQLFTFQISQPGADYASYLPARQYMGIAGTTVRTFADFNIRADHFKAPITSYNPPPYFGKSENSFASLPFTPPGGQTGPAFTRNLAFDPLPWGYSPFGPQKTVLFSFPKKLLSLGQLQHTDLTADDATRSVSLQPGNAFGNSFAPPLLKRHLTVEERQDFLVIHNRRADPSQHNYYDISYLLNTSVWDHYFLSTIRDQSSPQPENPNLVATFSTDTSHLHNPQKVASQLGVNGAFNINSTNKHAWIAFLSRNRHLRHPSDKTNPTEGAFFPRSLEQTSQSTNPPTGNGEDSWSGYRRLTDDEIELLADQIVRQVRLRGPFTSLAHFINRSLLPLTNNTEFSRSGPLQAAIDKAGLTITPDRQQTAFANLDLNEDKVKFQRTGIYPQADIIGNDPTEFRNPGPEPVWAPRSADNNPGAIASILSDRDILTDGTLREEQGNRSTGIPGWLTQADLLQVIGPSISVRSDTFRIRAYGEAVDPNSGEVTARAWCEAIVQRTPQYVNTSDSPETETASLNDTNKKYGRKFIITSFRWLSGNEI